MNRHQQTVGKSDTWLTPVHILTALGDFDLDPCAAIENPTWCAPEYFTVHDNGMSKPWHGRVWLNPPYGKETRHWLARLAEHDNGIALIFARTDTEWFFDHVWNEADAVYFIAGRLNFLFPNGRPSPTNAGAGSCLVAYGYHNKLMLRDLGDKNVPGQYVELR